MPSRCPISIGMEDERSFLVLYLTITPCEKGFKVRFRKKFDLLTEAVTTTDTARKI